MIKNILFRQKHLDRSEIIWLVAFAGFLGTALVYPLWADSYTISIMRDTVIFGLLALSLDYLWGKSGLLSFGHAAFFGMGAYAMAVFSLKLNTIYASMIGIAAAVVVPGLVAFLRLAIFLFLQE